jgi:hypothetical protein
MVVIMRNKCSFWLLVITLLGGCASDWFPSMELVDSTCAELLCGWQVEQGALQPSGSWHPQQRALQLTGTPARISKRLPYVPYVQCLSIEVLGDISREAELYFEIDFNDDATVDTSAPVPPSRWRRVSVGLRTPPEYRSVRVALHKKGAGDARIVSLALDAVLGDCRNVTPTTLADGSVCTLDTSCSSGRCALGRCSRCPEGGCAEGEACRSSDECRDGACAAGTCRACAKDGSCAPGQGCSTAGQCAGGSCISGAQPSTTRYPGQDGVCGDCDADADCGGGFCVLGRCASCRDDADCGEGVCRYSDALEATARSCQPRITSPAARGGLCESNADCAAGLTCGAAAGRAKRCGIACATDTDCGDGGICAAAGVSRLVDSPAKFALLPAWSAAAGRIATCHRASPFGGSCEVQDQCATSYLACCNGRCDALELDAETNLCHGPETLN